VMSTIYLQQGEARQTFVDKVFQHFDVGKEAGGRNVLLKPNIVSYEPYPTTTHPVTIEACLELLKGVAKGIIVGDGPAWDAGDSKSIIENHILKKSCDKYGIELVDLLREGVRLVETRSYKLEVSELALQCDIIISLPVLKSHGVCSLTGALKNHLGLLSVAEKRRLHDDLDVHRVIAELNEVIKPDLYIVDAVQTLVNTNEARHGGKPGTLGYMLAGSDPLSLDTLGLDLMSEVEPRLRGKHPEDIRHLRHAADLSLGTMQYKVIKW